MLEPPWLPLVLAAAVRPVGPVAAAAAIGTLWPVRAVGPAAIGPVDATAAGVVRSIVAATFAALGTSGTTARAFAARRQRGGDALRALDYKPPFVVAARDA